MRKFVGVYRNLQVSHSFSLRLTRAGISWPKKEVCVCGGGGEKYTWTKPSTQMAEAWSWCVAFKDAPGYKEDYSLWLVAGKYNSHERILQACKGSVRVRVARNLISLYLGKHCWYLVWNGMATFLYMWPHTSQEALGIVGPYLHSSLKHISLAVKIEMLSPRQKVCEAGH